MRRVVVASDSRVSVATTGMRSAAPPRPEAFRGSLRLRGHTAVVRRVSAILCRIVVAAP